MPARQKVLLLLRHAKSDWDSGVVDHERSLSPRGQRDALAVGQRLARQGFVTDLLLCSTAVRTRQTWDRAVLGGASTHQTRYLFGIYQASVGDLVAMIHELPEETQTVLLIGHAPGVPDLVYLLGSRTADSIWARLDEGYPTAGLAVLTLPDRWSEASPESAQLAAFEVPRRMAAD